MLKFFRKYNKYILAVGASVLMVVFLLPTGTQLFQPDPSLTCHTVVSPAPVLNTCA